MLGKPQYESCCLAEAWNSGLETQSCKLTCCCQELQSSLHKRHRQGMHGQAGNCLQEGHLGGRLLGVTCNISESVK